MEELILRYLERTYIFKDVQNIVDSEPTKLIFARFENRNVFGCDIVKNLPIIFSVVKSVIDSVIKLWASRNGINEGEAHHIFKPRKLKTAWSPELAQDVIASHNIDAEAELISLLSESISKEIDSQILKELNPKNADDFLGIVKCLGYEISPLMHYNPENFIPTKNFISLNYNVMMNERQNNANWQNWLRTKK